MAIEFNCPHCGKLLKTREEKAGLSAKCPDCNGMVTVPGESVAAAVVPKPDPWDSPNLRQPSPAATEEEPDIGAPLKPCPMCGKQIRAAAKVCRYCGERFGTGSTDGTVRPTAVEAGAVISTAWETFKTEFGMVIAGPLLAAIAAVGAAIALYVVLFVGALAIGGLASQLGRDAAPLAFLLLIPLMLVFYAALIALQVFMSVGLEIYLLRIARGEKAQLGDLFAGGRFVIRGILLALVMGLAVFGIALVIGAPFVVLAIALQNADLLPILFIGGYGLLFLAMMYLGMRAGKAFLYLVDQDCGPIEAIQGSFAITAPNFVAQIVLLPLMGLACYFVGLLMCGIGVLVTMPFFQLLQAVAYLKMSGQSAAGERA